MESHATIRLHATPPSAVTRDQTYFAFGDGRFGYDCVSCRAQCCRGHGYNLGAEREVRTHYAISPALRFFVEPSPPGVESSYKVTNCPPTCFFLDRHDHCRIHAAHGYDAKPETCRLFPFNGLRRVADWLIVTPHIGLCPLRILPPGAASEQSRHDRLFEAMAAHGIGSRIQEAPRPCRDVAAALRLERAIVAESERQLDALDFDRFVEAQIALTASSLERIPGIRWDDVPANELVRRSVDAIAELLGMMPTSQSRRDPVVIHSMVASTPVFRSRLLFDQGKHAEGYEYRVRRVPHMLLALSILAALARDAGMEDFTYQSAASLLRNYGPLLTVLAYADCEMAWKPGVTIDWPFTGPRDAESRYLAIVRALLPSTQRTRHKTLGRILCDHLDHDDSRRITLLKQISHRLAGRIVPMADPLGTRQTARPLKAAVQRWVFAHVNHGLMVAMATQLSTRSPSAGERPSAAGTP